MTEQTSNLIINLDHADWILNDDSQTLESAGFGTVSMLRLVTIDLTYVLIEENETEASFFNRLSYDAFIKNPEVIVQIFRLMGCFLISAISFRPDGNETQSHSL